MQFIFHNSPYWIRRDGAPSLCFLRFIIVLMIHCVPSQNKRLKARKESPLLSLQHRAENNQCNPKLFAYPQCHRDLRSSVMVQIHHTARVKNVIIYIFKKKKIFYKSIYSIQRKETKPTSTQRRHRKVRETNQRPDLPGRQQRAPDTLRLSAQQIRDKLFLGFKEQEQSLSPNQKESVKANGSDGTLERILAEISHSSWQPHTAIGIESPLPPKALAESSAAHGAAVLDRRANT